MGWLSCFKWAMNDSSRIGNAIIIPEYHYCHSKKTYPMTRVMDSGGLDLDMCSTFPGRNVPVQYCRRHRLCPGKFAVHDGWNGRTEVDGKCSTHTYGSRFLEGFYHENQEVGKSSNLIPTLYANSQYVFKHLKYSTASPLHPSSLRVTAEARWLHKYHYPYSAPATLRYQMCSFTPVAFQRQHNTRASIHETPPDGTDTRGCGSSAQHPIPPLHLNSLLIRVID
ncbi:hypothetical protein C7212DRAFT_346000 [Tuber magnatum]|uniref:Uncharacterized protein n=1 Tax=Tuber magnatum TaxID=42249 RepID=A0A317SN88_9PEZI|nr:hypothetical protein C7212DRAFT_346000 [Tuber magnatum]